MGVISIFERAGKILESNINAILDKLEDPEKMIDQLLVDAREDLADVKKETVAVRADVKAAERDLNECKKKIEDYNKAAQNAVLSGKDDDARTLIQSKQAQEAALPQLQTAYDALKSKADKLTAMHNKLVGDIETLEARKNGVKATMAAAKAQESANKMSEHLDRSSKTMSAFERMEAKANAKLDRAEAESEMNAEIANSDADSLAAKYGAGSTSGVDDELARMKAELAAGQAPTA